MESYSGLRHQDSHHSRFCLPAGMLGASKLGNIRFPRRPVHRILRYMTLTSRRDLKRSLCVCGSLLQERRVASNPGGRRHSEGGSETTPGCNLCDSSDVCRHVGGQKTTNNGDQRSCRTEGIRVPEISPDLVHVIPGRWGIHYTPGTIRNIISSIVEFHDTALAI